MKVTCCGGGGENGGGKGAHGGEVITCGRPSRDGGRVTARHLHQREGTWQSFIRMRGAGSRTAHIPVGVRRETQQGRGHKSISVESARWRRKREIPQAHRVRATQCTQHERGQGAYWTGQLTGEAGWGTGRRGCPTEPNVWIYVWCPFSAWEVNTPKLFPQHAATVQYFLKLKLCQC